MNVLIAFLLDAYQAHKDSFDNQVNINGNFAYNSTQGKVAKEPWLKQLEKVSKTRGIDISNYTLQLKSHAGDVYKAMYGDADEVTTESFSSFTEGDSRPSRDSFGFRYFHPPETEPLHSISLFFPGSIQVFLPQESEPSSISSIVNGATWATTAARSREHT